MLKYPAIVRKDSDGLWLEFPDLKGALTQGDTMEELLSMGEDVLEGYLGILLEDGKDIPQPSNIKRKNVIYINVPSTVAIPILLKKYRKEKKITQGEIANKLHVKYQTIQKLEKAKCNPTIKTLRKIAKALNKKLIVDLT